MKNRHSRQPTYRLAIVFAMSTACSLSRLAAQDAGQDSRNPLFSVLENEVVRVAVDLHRGGSIVWLSSKREDAGDPTDWSGVNLVNNFDLGRQIQPAFYGGPVPFSVGEKRPVDHWKHLGWNPVPSGDDFGHRGYVLAHRNDGTTIETTCHPMQWPLDDVPADCLIRQTITLDGAAVLVRGELTMKREDETRYPARPQELPAVYTNAPFHRLIAYTGPKPWQDQPIATIDDRPVGEIPWVGFTATESWAAHVGNDGFGLGVWSGRCQDFLGGFAGTKGVGGEHDTATGYIAPLAKETLDANLVYDFEYGLIVGSGETIRATAQRLHQRRVGKAEKAPEWMFTENRDGWHALDMTESTPTTLGWTVRGRGTDPRLIGPRFCHEIRPTNGPSLDAVVITATVSPTGAADGHSPGDGELFFAFHDHPEFTAERRLPVAWIADGRRHEIRLDVRDVPWWTGSVTQLRLDPFTGPTDATIQIESIRCEHAPTAD